MVDNILDGFSSGGLYELSCLRAQIIIMENPEGSTSSNFIVLF